MRNLCSKCLDLHTTEGFPASTDKLSENQSKTSVVCGRFQETLQDLIDSAAERVARGNVTSVHYFFGVGKLANHPQTLYHPISLTSF